MEIILAGLILVATLTLMLIRPKDVSEAWWAVLGGGPTLVLGVVTLRQVGSILLETQDALVLLVGMMTLSAIAEKAGFFDWAASLTARAGGGSVLKDGTEVRFPPQRAREIQSLISEGTSVEVLGTWQRVALHAYRITASDSGNAVEAHKPPGEGPGKLPLGHTARFVVDHALCDVILPR